MKLQHLALGMALAVAGSAFAATVTHDTTMTRETPNGTVTRHIVRTNEPRGMPYGPHHFRKVVIVKPEHRRHEKKVVIVHPAQHGRYAANRTVVVHRNG